MKLTQQAKDILGILGGAIWVLGFSWFIAMGL